MALLKCPQVGGKWELCVLFVWKNKHLWEAGFIKVFEPTSTAQLFIWKDLTHLLCRLLCGHWSICSCTLQMACAQGPLMETCPQQSMYPTHQAKRTIIYAKNGPGLTVKSIHKLPRGSPVELLKRTGCLCNGHHVRWKLWLSFLSST